MPNALSLNMAPAAARFQRDMTRYAQRIQRDLGAAMQAQMASLRQSLIVTSPVDTGHLQAQWGAVQDVGTGTRLAYMVENPTLYGPVLEYGGYRGVGPRTVALAGGDLGAGFAAGAGIYSQQAPLGWVRRALAGTWGPLQRRVGQAVREAWPYTPGLTGDVGALFGIDLAPDTGALSPGAARMVHEVMQSLRTRRGRS